MFRRHNETECFFCRSRVPTPRNPLEWCCEHCGCWNRRDHRTGELISFEPAMQEESLNRRAFQLRGSPSKNTLPTMYPSQSPFCRTCQTNHMMSANLLSDYLPPQDDPEYESRLASLPAYQKSLEARYPPVCESCLPSVQEKIREQDLMARSAALGGLLQNSKVKEIYGQRKTSGDYPRADTSSTIPPSTLPVGEMLAWKLRGVLWAATLLAVLSVHTNMLLGWYSLPSIPVFRKSLPLFSILSIFWTAWDPYYGAKRRAERQGRDVRLKGKEQYIRYQMLAWLGRFVTSTLFSLRWDIRYLSQPIARSAYFGTMVALELFCLVASFATLRLAHPPKIRLLDTSVPVPDSSGVSGSQPAAASPPPPPPIVSPPPSAEADLLSGLTLSSKPVMTQPIFGQPSLSSLTRHSVQNDEDAMDWSPTDGEGQPSPLKPGVRDAASYIRPQKFFPREEPTGLEALFQKAATIGDEDTPMTSLDTAQWPRMRFHVAGCGALMMLLIALAAGGVRLIWTQTTPEPSAVAEPPIPYNYLAHSCQLHGECLS